MLCMVDRGVSLNGGFPPKSSILIRDFHDKSSILGFPPIFGNTHIVRAWSYFLHGWIPSVPSCTVCIWGTSSSIRCVFFSVVVILFHAFRSKRESKWKNVNIHREEKHEIPTLRILIPNTLTLHLKMDGWNTRFLLGWAIFRRSVKGVYHQGSLAQLFQCEFWDPRY